MQRLVHHPSVVISTPQRIVNLIDGRIKGGENLAHDLARTIGLLFVDEAHRAAAPSYQRIIDLVPIYRRVSMIGLTATPFRMQWIGNDPDEGVLELKRIFRKLIEAMETLGENPRKKLQELAVLAQPVFQTIATHTIMRIPNLPVEDPLPDEDAERIDRALGVRADNSARRLTILEKLKPLAKNPDNSILYFGPSVRDAECMAFLLRREHVPAAVISGTTRDATRRMTIKEFKNKRVRVLCNCEVLTTGFDAPQVSHLVMARPTVSRVLYEQMIGRGLRGPRFGGTKTCVIIDCEDNYKGDRPELGYESFRRIWQYGN